jgi:predicted DNA-binding transcriptional regulator AlpA
MDDVEQNDIEVLHACERLLHKIVSTKHALISQRAAPYAQSVTIHSPALLVEQPQRPAETAAAPVPEPKVGRGPMIKAGDLLDITEAASLLGMSKKYLYTNADQLSFTVRLPSGGVRFSRCGIERWILSGGGTR